MGCWNKTCGLSNLHITYKTPVYVFVLERMLSYDDQCYSKFLYRPLLLPFYSEYNDYGAGENSSGPFLDLIMDSIKENLIEVEPGENPHHDIAVKRDLWNEQLFWDAIHENRLKVRTYNNGATHIDVVMFRKDIVDQIIQNWTVDLYLDGGYINYNFGDLLDTIPSVVERAKQQLAKYPADIAPLMCRLENLYNWKEHKIVSPWLYADHRYSRIVDINQTFFDLVANGNDFRASLLLAEHLKAKWLDSFMNGIRKLWTPGGFEGSQSQDKNGYLLMARAVTEVLHRADEED